MTDVPRCVLHRYETCRHRRAGRHPLSSQGPQHGPRRVCAPPAAGPGRGAQPGGSLWSGPGAASVHGARRREDAAARCGGLGLPTGRWPPATPGRLGEHAWRERPWPRNALRDLTRSTPLGLVSPTCGRASVTPAFLGRFQGRTAADFSEGPGSKEVWKRRQRSRGDWGGGPGPSGRGHLASRGGSPSHWEPSPSYVESRGRRR